MSAYCLIYVLEETIIREQQAVSMPLRLYLTSEHYKVSQDMYTTILPEHLKKKVAEDNKIFQDEISEYKDNNIVSEVIKSYNDRFQLTNELAKKTKEQLQNIKNSPPPLITFW